MAIIERLKLLGWKKLSLITGGVLISLFGVAAAAHISQNGLTPKRNFVTYSSPVPTATLSSSPTPSPSASQTPAPVISSSPKATQTRSPSPQATVTLAASPSTSPTSTPSPSPSPSPSSSTVANGCTNNANPSFSNQLIDPSLVTNILPPPNIAKPSEHLKTHSYVDTAAPGV
ncbi:MAG: hypothetical protein CEO22_470, partial [Candidatus Berkelbacteria bacterium Gr01-1014_85]